MNNTASFSEKFCYTREVKPSRGSARRAHNNEHKRLNGEERRNKIGKTKIYCCLIGFNNKKWENGKWKEQSRNVGVGTRLQLLHTEFNRENWDFVFTRNFLLLTVKIFCKPAFSSNLCVCWLQPKRWSLRNITDCSTFSFHPLSRTRSALCQPSHNSNITLSLPIHRHLLEALFKFHFCIIWYVKFYILQNFVYTTAHTFSSIHITGCSMSSLEKHTWFEFSTTRQGNTWRNDEISFRMWFISIIMAYVCAAHGGESKGILIHFKGFKNH